MRRLEFIEKGRLEWVDADEPEIKGEGEALVRPLALATCDLDLMIVRGRAPVPGPFAFGHECVAEVTVAGADAGFAEGDLVSVPFQISCGECERCLRGQTGSCTEVPRLSMYGLPLGGDYGGFMADSVRVPFARAMLMPVPADVDPVAIASLSDNIPDGWRTVAPQLEAAPGSSILICAGAGSIPVYAAGIAVALGAERVDFAGGSEGERALAAAYGANLVEAEFPERLGPYPITVDASGRHDGLHCALRSTEPDGTCTSIGIYYEAETPIPLLEMYTKGIHFHTGRVHARPAMEPLLDLIRSGAFDPAPVTAQVVDWDDAEAALSALDRKTVVTRAQAG